MGSVCLPDAESVFKQCSEGMPNRLKRIPDGETGERNWFTLFQVAFFQAVPQMITEFINNSAIAMQDYTPEQVAEGIEKLRKAAPSTQYDTVAIESYDTFKKLREDGVIPKGTRFQVCIPAVANVIIPLVQKDFMAAAEPVYEEALFRAMRNIQDTIPHEDLAIQIDLAADTALWENIEMYRPWFHTEDKDMDKRKAYIVDYIVRMISQVDQDVEVGFHNCYGDMEHRHWKEPESLANITERGLAVFEKTPHPINFFHMPVPKSAMEKLDAYYEPLKELLPKFKEHGTDLYLGVVHENDLEGSQKRLDAAKKAFGDTPFGIGTECGWGRTQPEDIDSIMQISTQLSDPVL